MITGKIINFEKSIVTPKLVLKTNIFFTPNLK